MLDTLFDIAFELTNHYAYGKQHSPVLRWICRVVLALIGLLFLALLALSAIFCVQAFARGITGTALSMLLTFVFLLPCFYFMFVRRLLIAMRQRRIRHD